jgi:2-octaprenyl-6-methoxyphenol hydroxylase
MQCDLVIVGGGMVGASLALALRPLDLTVALLEEYAHDSGSQPSFDERTTALGNSSRRIFEALGVWDAMRAEAAPIRTIHVSERGGFGFARLRAHEQGVDAFGYVVANRVIGRALWEALRRPDPAARGRLELFVPAIPTEVETAPEALSITSSAREPGDPARPLRLTTRLLVAADGARSSIREKLGIGAEVEDYRQCAVIARVVADTPNDDTAYERFTATGPIAVLPLHDGSYTVIWTLAPERAQQVLGLDDREFLAALQLAFGWRSGRFIRVGRRATYPLTLTRAAAGAARTVLIGNASQALHPVAGQGFNLGLRDAVTLAEVIAEFLDEAEHGPRGDVGNPALLGAFTARRAADRRGVTRLTDGLIRLFGDQRPGLGIARNLGLLLFDLAPPAKRALSRLSSGFDGRSSRLARGLGLE